MIAEIVMFDLPRGIDRAAVLELYRQSAAAWLGNSELIEKFYFFDEAEGLGGGIYFWPSREAAARWHGNDYRSMIRSRNGSEPRIHVLEALMRVDVISARTVDL